ncbi:hypothetical protein [Flavobacterium capsici]|uniref:Uncharacterized protein n=1 Tax=Flavobacterium capsici TaxID=3075618 RepID=A0AA96J3S5_9FLAO|nr:MULTISPECIES: hypothetical protein [unclassified Flavobacterium]WNM19693.1 hypothetical protein RN608_03175 [Flavobacterium sp. PMR2A8]WNM21082.1 hypothetical protein RN605_10345 [Flavobacterium sp. PMTSA4]
MNSKIQKPVFVTFILAILLFCIHKVFFFFYFPKEAIQSFIYSLELLYLFFGFSSVLIVFLLVKINQKNINNVGYTFLLVTSVKMALAYFFLQPILNSNSEYIKIQKINFFIIFIVFLAIETTVTIKMLNKKQ